MREKLAHAIGSSNLRQIDQDCPIDKIHALGVSAIDSPIGVSAIRFLDAMQPKSYNELIYSLQRKAMQKMKCDRKILLRVCAQVVREASYPFCITCLGRKQMLVGERVIKCTVCDGSGLHVHSDTERAKHLQISLTLYQKYWAKNLNTVAQIFSASYRKALNSTKFYLTIDS